MLRFAPAIGLLVGVGVLLSMSAPASAQNVRGQLPAAPTQPGLVNNPAALQLQQQKIVGFNVVGPNGNTIPNGGLLNPANNPASPLNNVNNPFGQQLNPYNQNPYGGYNSGFNPYVNPYLNPYSNPYLANPYLYNPYLFLNTGVPTGAPSGLPYPNPINMYNLNLNYQALTNPYLNPLSNPAFSGPFSPGPYSALAPLQAMGINNLLQSFPLNPNLGQNPNTLP